MKDTSDLSNVEFEMSRVGLIYVGHLDDIMSILLNVAGLYINIFAYLPFGQVSCKFYLPSKPFACPMNQMTSDQLVNLSNVPAHRASINQILLAPPSHLVVWASRATTSVEPCVVSTRCLI